MASEYFFSLGMLLALSVSAAGILLSSRLLHAVIMGGAFSLAMTVEYVFLGAPDVAMTEAAVGGGVSSVLMLMAIFYVGEDSAVSEVRYALPVVVCAALLGALSAAFLGLPSVGSAFSPPALGVAADYIQNVGTDIDVPNMVTAVLASYRGADTFGETAVVFAAGISVYAIMTAPAYVSSARAEGEEGA